MRGGEARQGVGCLLIDDFTPGEDRLSGLSLCLARKGVAAVRFCPDGGDLLDGLREAYYAARRDSLAGAIVGAGSGCWAALALAEQLPTARLVLADPMPWGEARRVPTALRRPLRRLAGFARRNLAFCVADVLVIEGVAEADYRRAFSLPNGRVTRLRAAAEALENGDDRVCGAVYAFLTAGELPKSLAENPEMCIIYG